jgi:hypothetical protein
MAVKLLPETFLSIVDTGMCVCMDGVRRLPYYVAQYSTYQGKSTCPCAKLRTMPLTHGEYYNKTNKMNFSNLFLE